MGVVAMGEIEGGIDLLSKVGRLQLRWSKHKEHLGSGFLQEGQLFTY